MSEALLRAIVRVSVGAVVALLIAAWRFFRTRSRRTKRAIVLTVLGSALLVTAYGFYRHYRGKRYVPRRPEDFAAVTRFVGENRERIEEAARRLDALAAIVADEGWLPEGHRRAGEAASVSLLIWAAELRGGDLQGFDPLPGELEDLRSLVDWARDPESITETYLDQPLDRLAAALDKVGGPLVAVGELTEVVLPEVTDLRFDPTGEVSGSFRPGRVGFRIAILELGSGRIVARGEGEATNRDHVRVTADAEFLNSDLWSATERAAWELARSLVPRGG